MAFVFNEGGAPIPVVPGTAAGGIRPPAAPATPTFSTGYLRTVDNELAAVRQATGLALTQQRTQGAFVYLGRGSGQLPNGNITKNAANRLKDIDTLMADFEAMPNEKKRDLAKRLAMAGFLDVAYAKTLDETVSQATLMDVSDAYANLLMAASARFNAGQNMSPDDILEMNIRYNLAAAGIDAKDLDKKGGKLDLDALYAKATGQSAGKPHTEVTKSKSYDIWAPEDARGLARNTLQSVLGRDPSEAEFEDFVTALQTKQRENPTITTTRTHYDAQGNAVRQSSTNTGGLHEAGIEELAREQAQAAPDYAEWQAVGTYFPAIMQALGAVVPGA